MVMQPRTEQELRAAIPYERVLTDILNKTDWQRSLCGQCCVAMAAGVSLWDAIRATGCLAATLPSDICNGLLNLKLKVNASLPIKSPAVVRYFSAETKLAHWLVVDALEPWEGGDKAHVRDPYTGPQVRYFARDSITAHFNITEGQRDDKQTRHQS
jgi:hypothetical protein